MFPIKISITIFIFVTLLSNIYTATTIFSLKDVNTQTNPTVSIEQECLKGSVYSYKISVDEFVFQPNIQDLVQVNFRNIGSFQHNGFIFGGEGNAIAFHTSSIIPNPPEMNIFAFLDLNSNNQFDDGEPSAPNTFIQINVMLI